MSRRVGSGPAASLALRHARPPLRSLQPCGPAPGCSSGALNAISSHSFCVCCPLCPDASFLPPSPPHLCPNVTSSKRISLIITPLSLSDTNTLLYFSSEHHLSPDLWVECKHTSIQTVCHMARSGHSNVICQMKECMDKRWRCWGKDSHQILRVIGFRCFFFSLHSFLYCLSNNFWTLFFLMDKTEDLVCVSWSLL